MTNILHISKVLRSVQKAHLFKLCLWGALVANSLPDCANGADKAAPKPEQSAITIGIDNLGSDDFLFAKRPPPECVNPANTDFSRCQPKPGPVNERVRSAFAEALKIYGAKMTDGKTDPSSTYRLTVLQSTLGYNLGVCRMTGRASTSEIPQKVVEITPQFYRWAVPKSIKSELDLTAGMHEKFVAECFGKFAQQIMASLRAAK